MKKINEWMVKIEDYLTQREIHLSIIDFIEKFMITSTIVIILIFLAATLIKD